jgi:hypothetical protein
MRTPVVGSKGSEDEVVMSGGNTRFSGVAMATSIGVRAGAATADGRSESRASATLTISASICSRPFSKTRVSLTTVAPCRTENTETSRA